MCYHYTIPDLKKLEQRFEAKFDSSVSFSRIYHVSGFTTPCLPVITDEAPNRIQMIAWGLIPHWVKDLKTANNLRIRTLNARAETLFEKPTFRPLINKKRCIVLADGFFEWRHYKGRTYPYYIQLQDQEPFAFAGLWNDWMNPATETPLRTYSIITTQANTLLEQVHNKRKRMPVILHQADEKAWIDLQLTREAIDHLLVPYKAAKMVAHPVSRLITTRGAKTNIPKAIELAEYPELPSIQL
ncbi:MAG: SOS response-associated peptidase [Candidatus Thorarchaeota archaeon]